MGDRTTLPLEAQNNKSVFLEHSWNIGRAYRNQALELISMCQLLSQIAPPKLAHQDAELRRMFRVCDMALRSAADSGTNETDEANALFREATRVLSSHSHAERKERLDLPLSIYSRMEIAQQKDSIDRDCSHEKVEIEWGPTMTVNFVLLRSPLHSHHNAKTVIVSQELSADPSYPEILWNFNRYDDHVRITLEDNPHLYLRCPTNESVYSPKFRRRPLRDPGGALEHNSTVYVLFDRPGRVFLTSEKPRTFGNVWSLNGFLIFRDRSGVLEGEHLVRDPSIRYMLWCREELAVPQGSSFRSRLNRSCLRPISTVLSADPSTDQKFEDWTVLSHPGSHCIDIHIYGLPGSTSSLDLPPPPPTSQRPTYDALYMTVNGLDDDILLGIFNYFRLEEKDAWNVRLGWCKLSHVCQRWRHLIHTSAFHLGMHILCTNDTPVVHTLDHLPPLPLFIKYQCTNATMKGQDELGISHALLLRDRVRRIDLVLPPSILHKFLLLMDVPFPILEHISLSFPDDKTTTLTLPKSFRAPNLRHLALLGIRLPNRLRHLTSTVSVVTLVLTNIRESGYFLPRLLVARLQSLTQLEELSIGFSTPIPRPSAERELMGGQRTLVMLPNLKTFRFRGVSAYLECLVARIRAPLLERLDIVLFNQIAFALPHLCQFANLTEGLKLPTAKVFFRHNEVALVLGHIGKLKDPGSFTLRVSCKQLDWQIDCAAQICGALMPALSGVEQLTLHFHEEKMPTEWQNGEIDDATWRELLRSFIRVKEFGICDSLLEELARSLLVDGIVSDPGLLPDMQDLICQLTGYREVNLFFDPFIIARRVAGHPVRLVQRHISLM